MAQGASDKVLDLDALYGTKDPIVIKHGGKKYTLARPEALGPREFSQLDALRQRTEAISKAKGTPSEEQSQELEQVSIDILAILCPKLNSQEMPFTARMHTIYWYYGEVAPKEAAALEKKMRTSRRQTTAKRSRR